MIYKELYLEFNKIRLKIKTNYGNYYDYLRLYFKDIIREDFKDGFHVSIEARWQRDDFKNYMSAVRDLRMFRRSVQIRLQERIGL